jgi:protein-disulfide isomerase
VNRQNVLLGLIGLAVVALCAVGYFVFFGGSSSAVTDGPSANRLQITSHDRALGSPDAPIQMVEYAAPSCPVCAGFDTQIFPFVKKNYIDTGKVYYVFRVYPLRSADVAAEAMARCLPKENYFSFIDMLYRNQDKWDPDGYQIPDVHAALVAMGATAGMSAQQVDTCIDNTAQQTQIAAIGQDAQTKYGISGTPSFLVNGQLRVGMSTEDDWKAYLDGLLAKK